MSLVRRNIVANVAGRGWIALLSLAVVPVHIHFLGIEAFGLIGFFLSLMAILSLLDLGLGTALNRQFAQYSMQSDRAQEMHDLLRTLELIYWLVGIGIGGTLVALAPVITAYWLKPQHLSTETISRAVALMGIAIAFQWPRTLYGGGLMGIQRQVAFNALSSAMATANNLGSVLILWLVSPTIQAYLEYFMIVSLIDTLLTRSLLRHSLPRAPMRPAFSMRLLASVWRFAAGMTGILFLSVILTQIDKMILVKVLALDAFGYYSVASRVAGGLGYLIAPISAAFFPRFSQLLLINDQQHLAYLYHRGCQLMSTAVLSVAMVLAFFSTQFLLLWTRDAAIATASGSILSLLVLGNAISGLTSLPLTIQLASGRIRLFFYTHGIAVIVLVPLTYFMSLLYGGRGAAWAYIIVNSGFLALYLPVMHRRLLPGHLRQWLVLDVGAPLAAALLVAGLWRWVIDLPHSDAWMLFNLGAVSLLTLLASTFAAPQIRRVIVHHLRGQKP